MMGVQPGYGQDNLSREEALAKATPVIGKYLSGVVIAPAVALYKSAWGCPAGGERGVMIRGTAADQATLENSVATIMAELGQSAATIVFPYGPAIAYIQNTYADGAERGLTTLLRTEVKRSATTYFIAHIDAADAGAIQGIIDATPDDEIIITGVLEDAGLYSGTRVFVPAEREQAYVDAVFAQCQAVGEVSITISKTDGNIVHY